MIVSKIQVDFAPTNWNMRARLMQLTIGFVIKKVSKFAVARPSFAKRKMTDDGRFTKRYTCQAVLKGSVISGAFPSWNDYYFFKL